MGRLREALATAAPASAGRRCKLAQFIDGLDAADRDEMLELLADPTVRDWEIRNVCATEFDFVVSDSLICRHKRPRPAQGCGCG
jgi:hypothetical protein